MQRLKANHAPKVGQYDSMGSHSTTGIGRSKTQDSTYPQILYGPGKMGNADSVDTVIQYSVLHTLLLDPLSLPERGTFDIPQRSLGGKMVSCVPSILMGFIDDQKVVQESKNQFVHYNFAAQILMALVVLLSQSGNVVMFSEAGVLVLGPKLNDWWCATAAIIKVLPHM